MEYPLADGFIYTATTPVGDEPTHGTGSLAGPDGSQAELRWELSGDGPYIMRLKPPGEDHWGVYQLGFTRPVQSEADLVANLAEHLPKLQVIYRRFRVH